MTDHTCISLDFYNSSFSIKINNKQHWWNNADVFVTETGFPFRDTVRIVSYEPERKIFHIERPDASFTQDSNAVEFSWINNNLNALAAIVSDKMEKTAQAQTITMAMIRQGNLYATDWVLQRHTEEELLGIPTTMNKEKLLEVMRYRQALRNLSESYALATPADRVSWPVSPLG